MISSSWTPPEFVLKEDSMFDKMGSFTKKKPPMRLESFEEEDETTDTEPKQFMQSQLTKGRRGSMPMHTLTGKRPDQRHNSVSQSNTQPAVLDPPKEGEIICVLY